MGRSISVLSQLSDHWHYVFGFWPMPKGYPAVESLRAMGVKDLVLVSGRTANGSQFTFLTEAYAQKGQVVDCTWLLGVRELCEQMAPGIFAEMMRVAGPDDDDPTTDFRDWVAEGEVMMHVVVHFAKETNMKVNVAVPAVDVAATEVQ